MTGFDPYAHATSLGINVSFRTMDRWHGLWFAPMRILILRANMTTEQERAVLTAYLAHAESGSQDLTIADERDVLTRACVTPRNANKHASACKAERRTVPQVVSQPLSHFPNATAHP